MKLFKYVFLVNFSLLCIPYQSFAGDSDQFDVPVIKQRASTGDIKALIGLGAMYYLGKGLPKDYSKAREYFQKAADQNSKEAQFFLGEIYFKGQGLPKDYSKAREYFQKAADQGFADAQFYLGSMYYEGKGVTRDPLKAMEYFQKAAAQGSEQAKFNINFMKDSKLLQHHD